MMTLDAISYDIRIRKPQKKSKERTTLIFKPDWIILLEKSWSTDKRVSALTLIHFWVIIIYLDPGMNRNTEIRAD